MVVGAQAGCVAVDVAASGTGCSEDSVVGELVCVVTVL